jgi:hypothetical protein
MRSLYDWTIFQQTKIGRACMKGKFLLYQLNRDATYPIQPWMNSPFKPNFDGLEPYKAKWNLIQFSTHMFVEHAFGILNGK